MTVPLQWMVVLVFVLHATHQALRPPPPHTPCTRHAHAHAHTMHMHMHTPCTCTCTHRAHAHAPGAQPAAAPRCGLTLTPAPTPTLTLTLTLTLTPTPTLALTHQALKLPPLLAAAGGAWVYRGTGSTVIEKRNTAAEESAPLDSLGLLAEAAKLLALLCFMARLLA